MLDQVKCAWMLGLTIALLTTATAARSDIILNEIVSSNRGGLNDHEGSSPDWIELYNPTDKAVGLRNYSLADGGALWRFPSGTIPARGFLVIFASDKNKATPEEFHTNFKIKSGGEKIILRNATGQKIDEVNTGLLASNQSLARMPDGSGPWEHMAYPSPGKANAAVLTDGPPIIAPVTRYSNGKANDQDDMTIWVHPDDPGQSLIIASDKKAYRVFVYSLDGVLLQTVKLAGRPGNIDSRRGFPLGGASVDIVALNLRDLAGHVDNRILVFRVDPEARQLVPIDNEAIFTGDNYGFCLSRHTRTGVFSAFVTSESGTVEQYRLFEAQGQVDAELIRTWDMEGMAESCVADDENGYVFIAEEDKAVWKFGSAPDDPVTGLPILYVNEEHSVEADLEGLAMYYGSNGKGYLLLSSQSNSEIKVLDRRYPHALIASLRVEGASHADGLDVMSTFLNKDFPEGLLVVHSGGADLLGVSWADLVKAVNLRNEAAGL